MQKNGIMQRDDDDEDEDDGDDEDDGVISDLRMKTAVGLGHQWCKPAFLKLFSSGDHFH